MNSSECQKQEPDPLHDPQQLANVSEQPLYGPQQHPHPSSSTQEQLTTPSPPPQERPYRPRKSPARTSYASLASQAAAGIPTTDDKTPNASSSKPSSPFTPRKGKGKEKTRETSSTRPIRIPGLKLMDGGQVVDGYGSRQDQGFGIHVKLGSEFGMPAETVLEEAAMGEFPSYHPAESSVWVTLARGATSNTLMDGIFGDIRLDLKNDYANMRMMLGFLFWGMSGQGDFVLHAVRPWQDRYNAWLTMGTPAQGCPDVVIVDLQRCSTNALARHMASNELQDVWWEPVGDLKAIRPIHPKDLRSKFLKTEIRAQAEFSEPEKRDIYGLTFAHAALKLNEAARKSWLMLQNPGAAHIIHATRGAGFFRAGVLGREFAGVNRQIKCKESLADASNGLWLPKDLHSLFDSKKLVILPFPNHGWKTSSLPRTPLDQFGGLEPNQSANTPVKYLPLAEEVLAVPLQARMQKKSEPESICCPTSIADQKTVLEEKWNVDGPRAAYLAYAAGARLIGRDGILDDDMFRWISRFNQPLCPDEDFLGRDFDEMSIASGSAASTTSHSNASADTASASDEDEQSSSSGATDEMDSSPSKHFSAISVFESLQQQEQPRHLSIDDSVQSWIHGLGK